MYHDVQIKFNKIYVLFCSVLTEQKHVDSHDSSCLDL